MWGSRGMGSDLNIICRVWISTDIIGGNGWGWSKREGLIA